MITCDDICVIIIWFDFYILNATFQIKSNHRSSENIGEWYRPNVLHFSRNTLYMKFARVQKCTGVNAININFTL